MIERENLGGKKDDWLVRYEDLIFVASRYVIPVLPSSAEKPELRLFLLFPCCVKGPGWDLCETEYTHDADLNDAILLGERGAVAFEPWFKHRNVFQQVLGALSLQAYLDSMDWDGGEHLPLGERGEVEGEQAIP